MSKIHHYFHKGLYLNILILKKIAQKLLEKIKKSLMTFQKCYLSILTARNHITKLRELGVIETRGKGKNTFYIFKE